MLDGCFEPGGDGDLAVVSMTPASGVGVLLLPVGSSRLNDVAAAGYCDDRECAGAPPNWFEAGLAYATTTLRGATAAL
jgi:hypothetical protein